VTASNAVFAIADAHNDLLLELVHRRYEERPFERHWLEPLRRGGVGLQVCPMYVGIGDTPENALRRAFEQVAAFNRAVRESNGDVVAVRTRADLDHLDGRLGLVLSLEGCEPLGSDPEAIEVFWELGVRMVGLTWNRRNAFADGLAEPAGGGLSRLGEELVDRMVALGMAIDLAHASLKTFEDVLARSSDTPVLVSHAGCRAVHDTERNLADEQLRALASRDGLLGVMLVPIAVGEPATIERVVDHVDHAVGVMGNEHVGFGGDFVRQMHRAVGLGRPEPLLPPGELDRAVEGLAGPEDYPALADALQQRGYGGERLGAILSENLLRFLRRALPA
jgi:membrane dipeptidase